jgi:hypothetical protein
MARKAWPTKIFVAKNPDEEFRFAGSDDLKPFVDEDAREIAVYELVEVGRLNVKPTFIGNKKGKRGRHENRGDHIRS